MSDHGESSQGKQRSADSHKEDTVSTTTKLSRPELVTSALSLFPLPHQIGAPFFDGTDVSDFVVQWEDLTMDWTDGQRIKKVPLYCEKMIGKYIKTLESYIDENNWEEFMVELKAEFKDDDTEQKRNTEAFLQSMVQQMRKEEDPTVAAYRSFIFEFAERSTLLVRNLIISPHTRAFMFLQAFSDKIGDKLCKRCGIHIDDARTTTRVWSDLKLEALKICTKNDSQMSKLSKSKMQGDCEHIKPLHKPREERKQKLETAKSSNKNMPETLDEVTQMMKDLQLSQLEAQRKLDEELAFLRDAFTKSPRQNPYYSPRQYGNRDYLPTPAMLNGIRGCYWDGENHRKEDCQDLKRAIERGDVYKRDRLTFLGQQGVGDDGVLVPVPHEVNGKIKWQKDWVREQQVKESEMPRALCITVENNRDKPMHQSATKVGKHDEKLEKPEKLQQHEKMWSTLQESVDIGELSKRTLDVLVPGVTVRELLLIAPDLIQ